MMCEAMTSPALYCIEITGTPLAVALRCAGEIDISSIDGLERALRASVETGAMAVEVDLRAVEYFDSLAMKALLAAYRTLVCDGRTLAVRVRPRAAALFHAVGLVELLNERGEPAAPGEPAEIVGTGFGNVSFPLIRYRTGDGAVIAERPCSCNRIGLTLKSLTMGAYRPEEELPSEEGQADTAVAEAA